MSEFVYTKVDPERLSVAAGNIDNCLNILENAFKVVDEILCVILRPTWTGKASSDFFKKYEIDAQAFSSHTKALISINNRLKEAAGVFDSADGRAKGVVSSLVTGVE